MWYEINHTFPNVNDATDEIWERVYDFMPHIIIDVIAYPCWDWSLTILVNGAQDRY